eukprot:TRINITY_DN503_c0_g2_i4.p1 TRINITY_DN503_c0_g2~~TRINITY_DN503_c0_g2_i4.p1  ORF type:complete len:247 (+),score=9.77 TRINITY_DN503_c0_g2_i4:268-1008(+)
MHTWWLQCICGGFHAVVARHCSSISITWCRVSDHAKETDPDAPNYEHHFVDLEGLVTLVNQHILSKLSKPRCQLANARQANSTQGWKSSRTEAWGPQYRPIGYLAPPWPAYGVSDVFPQVGVGVFPRTYPRSMDGGMIVGPNDPRWSCPRFNAQDILGEHSLIVSAVGRLDPFLTPAGTGFDPRRYPAVFWLSFPILLWNFKVVPLLSVLLTSISAGILPVQMANLSTHLRKDRGTVLGRRFALHY